ncbi:hypothetical protein QQ045_017243 [Rhodiola kirilowii]
MDISFTHLAASGRVSGAFVICSNRPPAGLSSDLRQDVVAQDVHNQEEVGEEDEAEQADSTLDPDEVQCQAQALAPYQAWLLRWI